MLTLLKESVNKGWTRWYIHPSLSNILYFILLSYIPHHRPTFHKDPSRIHCMCYATENGDYTLETMILVS